MQLVVYPGFRRIDKNQFVAWHTKYLRVAGIVIGPLMIGQLGIAVWKLTSVEGWVTRESLYASLVTLTWITTFRIFVPMHKSLQEDGWNARTISQLVVANWMRTFLWSSIVLVTP